MPVVVTALYTAITALLMLALAYRVVAQRRIRKVGVGTGGEHELEVAMRIHGNLVENAPIVLLLLLVAELNGLAAIWLHLAGALFIVCRVLHAWGMTATRGGVSFGRFWGTLGTWVVILTLAGMNVGMALRGTF